ncbi:Uncharacterised protein [Klebsiella pneumoniae]|nr:Uncharacterised protein [Klebsiella pneumoniae]
MNAYRAYDAIEERKWAEQSLTEEKQKWIDDRAQEIIDALPERAVRPVPLLCTDGQKPI